MTEDKPRLVLTGIAVACLALAAIGCSNYQPNKIAFHFTPIPVTALPSGTPVSLDANCNVFKAGEVVATSDEKQHEHLERWLDDIGFTVLGNSHPPDYYYISVPMGSVPDAIALIAKQPGVRSVEREVYGGIPEDGPPGERYFGCKAPR